MQTIREIDVEIFMPNFAVLRAAVFPLFTKENAVFAIGRNVERAAVVYVDSSASRR